MLAISAHMNAAYCSLETVLRQHPCLTEANILQNLLGKLKVTGIQYFAHTRTYQKKSFICFSSDPAYLKQYLQRGYYNYDVHMAPSNQTESYLIWDTVERESQSKQLHDDFSNLGFGHTFSIIQAGEHFKDVFFFATTVGNQAINAQYFQLMPHLKSFIYNYKALLYQDKLVSKIQALPMALDSKTGGYHINASLSSETPLKLASDLRRYYIPGSNVYLTEKEFQCLTLAAQGQLRKTIAASLDVSERTVKAHMESAKDKLGCTTLFQLGMFYQDLKLE